MSTVLGNHGVRINPTFLQGFQDPAAISGVRNSPSSYKTSVLIALWPPFILLLLQQCYQVGRKVWKASQRDCATTDLFLARAIVLHAVLGSHGLGAVQGGRVERDLLNLGNVARNVRLPQPFCLVLVPPVLEELLEQRCLTTLREDLDLKGMSL